MTPGAHDGSRPDVLSIRNLSIDFPGSGNDDVVCSASLNLARGEIRGLVGESGSGKTMLARAALGLLPPGARFRDGNVCILGEDISKISEERMRQFRGAHIGMVFQEPMTSLNPTLKIGEQMAEAMRLHTGLDSKAIRDRSIEMLERVRMASAESCLNAYPHEFSGGMRQRIMLASVLMLRPTLLLADEPTTALDVLIQKEILEIMVDVVNELDTAVLLISHDLGLVARYAHTVSVMRQGKIVEDGSVTDTLIRPRHDYTRQLLNSLPRRNANTQAKKPDIASMPLVEVRDLQVTFTTKGWLPFSPKREVRAVDGVSLSIHRRETVALVGESGSGKTTLGRALLRLVGLSGGGIKVDGQNIHSLPRKASQSLRRRMQIVFQDPYSSLDPRKRIGTIVGEGLRLFRDLSAGERSARVNKALEAVGIPSDWADRFPHQLSGGQRQRVAIARAVITEPELVVADEAVSALDLTVQAQVLVLLKKLQRNMGFSYLFISHDLGVVEQVADRIVVLYRGRVVESGTRDDIFDNPRHPYTCSLLNAVPNLSGDVESGFRVVSRDVTPSAPPPGFGHDEQHKNINQGETELVSVSPTHTVRMVVLDK